MNIWLKHSRKNSRFFQIQPTVTPLAPRVVVPKSFVGMANCLIWYRDGDRFARLYAFLWRLHDAPSLMHDRDAALMIVGKQPGEVEDQTGCPFVGPADQLFDQIAAQAGLDRQAAFITNAVNHLRFRSRGKRWMHQTPTQSEVIQCKWWLEAEVALVTPKLIVAMGGTALLTVARRKDGVLKRRGQIKDTAYGPVLLTLHPSCLLRLPDAARRGAQTALFRDDLEQAARLGQGHTA
ncbi:uracil DNA glycosylase superfamily protein [Pseudosulfitobacter pseudonitzschiae]|uniref:Type-4 uracil-DNA glycosylase n=2 Tax=Pseudosulfitobacter pseudonitzschiae TaxID=1402135 RepID=A0A221K2Y1_9RHOB|nr:uracil DNA glycosylase superfamily protein [Pseudosulfitobacter pseudonitzschiae]